jgi:hypothetical protein
MVSNFALSRPRSSAVMATSMGTLEVVLRNIMQNIVDHGGGFVPPPRDEYEDEDNYEDDD